MVVCDSSAHRYVFCRKQEAATLEFPSCLCIIYGRKIFFNSSPAVILYLPHVVKKKKKKHDWGYFQLPKSLLHIQLSPSVNYTIQWQRQKEGEKEIEMKTDRESCSICAVLVFYAERVDMSPGISSAHAQVSLNDLYEHPHSTAGHTHTLLISRVLSSFRHTNTLYEHPKSIALMAGT